MKEVSRSRKVQNSHYSHRDSIRPLLGMQTNESPCDSCNKRLLSFCKAFKCHLAISLTSASTEKQLLPLASPSFPSTPRPHFPLLPGKAEEDRGRATFEERFSFSLFLDCCILGKSLNVRLSVVFALSSQNPVSKWMNHSMERNISSFSSCVWGFRVYRLWGQRC